MIEHVDNDRSPFRVTRLATGGTLEKTYDPHSGPLTLAVPVIQALLDGLDQPDVTVRVARVMAKDSLDMADADRNEIVETTRAVPAAGALAGALDMPGVPVVLTGAMRPSRVADSDAAQNVAQALMAARLLVPGVYAVPHGCAVRGDRAVKNDERLTISPRAMSSANAQHG